MQQPKQSQTAASGMGIPSKEQVTCGGGAPVEQLDEDPASASVVEATEVVPPVVEPTSVVAPPVVTSIPPSAAVLVCPGDPPVLVLASPPLPSAPSPGSVRPEHAPKAPTAANITCATLGVTEDPDRTRSGYRMYEEHA